MGRVARLLVRATVHLPDDDRGRSVRPGQTMWVDTDDPSAVTQLSVGHLVPVGVIPRLEPDPDNDV